MPVHKFEVQKQNTKLGTIGTIVCGVGKRPVESTQSWKRVTCAKCLDQAPWLVSRKVMTLLLRDLTLNDWWAATQGLKVKRAHYHALERVLERRFGALLHQFLPPDVRKINKERRKQRDAT